MSIARPGTPGIVATMIAAGARIYKRDRDLPKLIAVWPREIEDYSVAGTEHIIGRLMKVCRAHRKLAERGHWSYDLNRHVGLCSALKAEQAHLAHLQNSQGLARIVGMMAA